MALTFRDEQGFPLNSPQADGNIHDLDDRVQAIEDNPPVAVGISNIVVSGTKFSIHLEDATIFGPFDLPVMELKWKGEWEALTGLFAFDLFKYQSSGIFLALQDHVTEAIFDPLLETTEGPVYQQIVGPFALAYPHLVHTDAELVLTLDHANTFIQCQQTDGTDVIVPHNDSVAFEEDTEIHFRQFNGTDPIVFVPEDENVTISGMDGFELATGGGGAVASLKKVGPNAWWLFGRLLESSTGTV